VLSRGGGRCLKNVNDHSEYFVWAMTECGFEPVGLRPSCIQGAHTHFPLFAPFGSIPHPLVLIHLRRSSSTTVSFHLMNPSLFQHVLHSSNWRVKFPLSFLLLTLLKFYYDVSMAANSMAYALMVCSDKPGYLVCHFKYAVYRVAQKSLVTRPVFLNRRAAARYRVLASIIPGCENLSF
jgi:hypothetical protein